MLAWLCHLASPDMRLIDVAMITEPSGNDSHACRSAVRRICLVLMLVSETWAGQRVSLVKGGAVLGPFSAPPRRRL
jgi:hypothetical protein